MFFVDGESTPSITGTGSEHYFLGAWDFGGEPFSYTLSGAPVVGAERAGAGSSVCRFHLDAPIPFTTSFKATIEHGHANLRSDNFYSVAYWYQTEPHREFSPLPSVVERLPTLQAVAVLAVGRATLDEVSQSENNPPQMRRSKGSYGGSGKDWSVVLRRRVAIAEVAKPTKLCQSIMSLSILMNG